MKVLSVLAIGTACSISLSFLVKVRSASAVSVSDNNHSFNTKNLLSPDTNTADGQLSPQSIDFYSFLGLEPGQLFDLQVNGNQSELDPLLALLDSSGNVLEINQDRSDSSIFPELTGIVPESGVLNLAVSGNSDTNLAGEHYESGSYQLSLKTFDLPKSTPNETLINGGFETGNFTGWTTLGENSIETSAFGSGPTEGKYEALLSTGGASFADSILEESLGLETGSIEQLINVSSPSGFSVPNVAQSPQGSDIQETFTAKAGDILTFDWDFLTDELPYDVSFSFPDISFVSLSSPSNSISYLSELADSVTFPSLVESSTKFFRETGFHTFSVTIPTDGIYTLGIGDSNGFDNFADSALLIDNVKISSVPEPSSVLDLLGISTFLGAGSVLKRKQRQKSSVVSNRSL